VHGQLQRARSGTGCDLRDLGPALHAEGLERARVLAERLDEQQPGAGERVVELGRAARDTDVHDRRRREALRADVPEHLGQRPAGAGAAAAHLEPGAGEQSLDRVARGSLVHGAAD
jgi:hypothetical protein